MDASIKEILAFLGSEDRELRWASARVLGALKPKEAEVGEALTKALASDDQRLRLSALQALSSIGSADSVASVIPMLEDPGEVGHAAADALFGMGTGVLGRLKRVFSKSGDTGRRRILDLAARLRGAHGLDLIVRALETGHADDVREVAGRLGDALAEATSRDRATLVRRIDKFLGSVPAKANPGTVAVAVDLLAHVVGPDAHERLFTYTSADHPPRVRRRALLALARLAPEVEFSPREIDVFFGYLKESDYRDVVAPAMEVLERSRLTAAHAPALLACLEGQDPALRRFAANALGQVDTAKSARALLETLRGDNPDLQRRAALSLARLKAAVPQVVAALAEAPDAANAWILARILQPHAPRLKAEEVAILARAASSWLEPGDPRAEPVLSILREHHRDALEAVILRRVKRIKKDRRAGETVNLLRPFAGDGQHASPEVRYELALAEVIRGPKDVVREVRLENAGLSALEGLLQEPDFPLLTRLKRDRSALEPGEYYLIGCHFAERSYGDRIFGGDLLRWLIQAFPDDTSAQAAEHKLLMEGFPPPPKRRTPPQGKKAEAAPAKRREPPSRPKAAAGKGKAPAKKAPGRKKPPAKKAPPKKAPAGKARAKKKKVARK